MFDTQKEKAIVTNYDFLMPLSEKSIEEINHFFLGNTFVSTTGCDWGLFDAVYKKNSLTKKINKKKRKVIGYVGNISAFRLNFELINQVSIECKNFDLIFAGPVEEDELTQKWVKKINALTNVNFIGEVKYANVPDLISSFNIGIIPYKLNQFNLGTNPNKFFEYSAMGVPCISTDIPSLRKFLPQISIVQTSNEWAKMIDKALEISDANRKELRALAKFYSPKESLERIDKLIA